MRVIGLSLVAFLVMLSYAFARPPVEGLFLQAHGKVALPYVWIWVALSSMVATWIYNIWVTRIALLRFFALTAIFSALIFLLLGWSVKRDIPYSRYLLYIWKDLYIVALIEIFYSYSNSVFPIKQARWTYSIFGVFSSLGSIVGNSAIGGLAKRYGSLQTLWLQLPILGLLTGLTYAIGKRYGIGSPLKKAGFAGKISEAVSVLRKSSYLILMLGLIGTVQIVVTLIDFDFQTLVEKFYPLVDQKTAAIGDVYNGLAIATLVLNILVGPTLRLLGIALTLFIIPSLLGISVATFIIMPAFIIGSIMKISSKAFDYTIFRASKEMLYIPLSYQERTQGKALVDLMTYRVAKGGASLLVMLLSRKNAYSLVRYLSLFFITIWFGLTHVITKRFRQYVSKEDENR